MEEVKATQVTYSSGMPVTVKLAEDNIEMRKGPWTLDEDSILIHYISLLGQGRWDSLAQFAGLKRSGKSCRLRWLNYLRPNLRRGKFTPQEQLLILLLHFRFGNRWAKIAEHLPGRTDNEVKNYWRTKVQKHANQLHCNVNSQEFRDVLRYQWLPSLAEQIRVTPSSSLHEYLMASSSTAHNKTTEVKENISPFLETGIGSTSITSPNVVSSTNSSEAELPPLMDNSLWSFSSSNWCSSFEDGYYLYSSQDQCHSWASVAGSELVPANETLVSSDLDLWLFP